MTREEREDAIKFFEEVAKREVNNAKYSKLAIKALEQEPILDKIRAEIEQDLEQAKIDRSVFRYKKINAVKAEQCTGSIAAYHSVIGIIDKYKEESEEK